MYNAIEIRKCFAELVGFFQPNDPNYPNIYPSLTRSKSGIWVQRTHPLCSLETIFSIAPEFRSFVYPDWSNNTDYFVNDIVSYEDLIYICIKDDPKGGNGKPDDANSEYWKLIDPLSEWLLRVYDSACSHLIYELLKYKKLNNVSKSLVENLYLYQGFGQIQNKVIKKNRFVGFEIALSAQKSILMNIEKIGIQSDDVESLPIYIYHSSQDQPIFTKTIDINTSGSFAWVDLTDVALSYMANNNDPNGVFYIGYYEDDLVGQVINRETDFSKQPCIGCNRYNYNAYNLWSKNSKIATFSVPEDGLDLFTRGLFDTSKVTYSEATNWGMNLSISIYCDLTEFFCANKMMFADALAMQIALDLINEIAFTTRLNVISDKTKNLAMAELDLRPESSSFKSEYIKTIKALDFDFQGFSSDCLPCNKTKAVTRSAI